jgi:hypothetical protein
MRFKCCIRILRPLLASGDLKFAFQICPAPRRFRVGIGHDLVHVFRHAPLAALSLAGEMFALGQSVRALRMEKRALMQSCR